MNRSPALTVGLGICVLLGLLDIVGLAGINADNAPPAAIVFSSAALGVLTVVGAGLAWRQRRGGVPIVVVSRVLAALLGIPAFFLDAPGWARVIVAISLALTVVGIGLIVAARRQHSSRRVEAAA